MAAGDSLVVHHRGRRYRRAHRRPEDAVKKEDLSRETGQSQSLPKPSLISETLPTELARLPRTTGDPHLFQRYKPLPPIGSAQSVQLSVPESTVSVCLRLPDGSRISSTLPTSSPLSSLVAAALSGGPVHDWTLVTTGWPHTVLYTPPCTPRMLNTLI
ncbi:hypothetical protein GBAR_LOCUS22641 [Geodia barretti]|uniref:Uncharacterized protein n=1 Tax=Geodia barretti TaxID=519541 RepID=A0AA35X7N8_GEOBA|nr:hypothetical protein GBAR_LOCUS22641 [Geodia barretti]